MTPQEVGDLIREQEFQLLLPRIRANLASLPVRVLEVGAGSCENAARLRVFGEVVAAEPFARGEPPAGVELVRAPAEALPFARNTFDLVFSTSVLEHIEHLEDAFREMKRVARPGGLFVHVVPTTYWKLLALGTHAGLLARAVGRRLGSRRTAADSGARVDPGAWREQAPPAARTWASRLLPPIHGTSRTNREELVDFLPSRWRARFHANAFEIVEEQPLLLYSPPELPYLGPTTRLRNLGVASCYAFFLRSTSAA